MFQATKSHFLYLLLVVDHLAVCGSPVVGSGTSIDVRLVVEGRYDDVQLVVVGCSLLGDG